MYIITLVVVVVVVVVGGGGGGGGVGVVDLFIFISGLVSLPPPPLC